MDFLFFQLSKLSLGIEIVTFRAAHFETALLQTSMALRFGVSQCFRILAIPSPLKYFRLWTFSRCFCVVAVDAAKPQLFGSCLVWMDCINCSKQTAREKGSAWMRWIERMPSKYIASFSLATTKFLWQKMWKLPCTPRSLGRRWCFYALENGH